MLALRLLEVGGTGVMVGGIGSQSEVGDFDGLVAQRASGQLKRVWLC